MQSLQRYCTLYIFLNNMSQGQAKQQTGRQAMCHTQGPTKARSAVASMRCAPAFPIISTFKAVTSRSFC